MFFLLLLASITATTLCLFLWQESRSGPYTALRLAFVQSLILHGIAVFLYNEVFSFFNLITPLTARLYWFIVAAATSSWLARSLRGRSTLQQLLYRIGNLLRFESLDGRSRFLLYTGFTIVILPLLALAIYAPQVTMIQTITT